ncbi:PaaI family thioesterase [Actinocorallia libanotica]|uniref:Acyl-coenzyme A thioesterase PaaI-like protein n=1 Tax=Actinocorallia libanotica TaxID=46162 RepID=A0ABP4C5C6_9ACTN
MSAAWSFGEEPLDQTRAFAAAVRALTETALSLEGPSPLLERLIADIRGTDAELRAAARVTPAVRVGARADDPGARLYLDHATDIGAFNPAFPEYGFREIGHDRASGSIRFPIVYEGPPGFVHGGFLAVFFDAVIAHHNCRAGVAGRTKSLEIRYTRPTPLGADLDYEIRRTVTEREVVSAAALYRGSDLLCTAEARNAAGSPEALPPVGRRGRRAPGHARRRR